MENVECLKFKLNDGKCWMFKVQIKWWKMLNV